MLQWIQANLGTILISLVLLAVVAMIIGYLVRERRQGKSTCGNNCAHCAMHGTCHKAQ